MKVIKVLIKVLFFLAVCVLIAGLINTLFSSRPADAESGANQQSALTEDQRDAISQNCSTIKQSLEQLQKVDSRTRTYLGGTYETILSKFVVPLNLRLVKNNRPTFSDLQADFTAAQNTFKNNYTIYMRDLETLISTDCQTQPDQFYQQLEATRTSRSALRASTETLRKLSDRQFQAVTSLREDLL